MIPKHLLLENFMSHARSELDFGQFDMALVIGSDNDNPDVSNGTGKTALFDGMLWALYGKCRFSTKKKLIKRGGASCAVTFVFELEGQTYKTVRRISKRSASAEVQFFIREGARWRDLSEDTPTATSKKIVSTIGMNHDTFINSVYFRQFDVSRFASATATQKKAILKEILQIGMWDKYQDKAKARMKKAAGRLTLLKERIDSFGDLEDMRRKNGAALERAERELDAARHAAQRGEVALDSAKRELANFDLQMLRLGDAPARQAALAEKEQDVLARRDRLRRSIGRHAAVIAEVEETVPGLKREILCMAGAILALSAGDARAEAEKVFQRFEQEPPSWFVDVEQAERDRAEMKEQEALLADLELQLRQLESLEPGEKCPCCLSEITDPEDVIARREQKRRYLKHLMAEKTETCGMLRESVRKAQKASSAASLAADRLGEWTDRLARYEERYTTAKEATAELMREGEGLTEEWGKIQTEKKALESLQDADVLKCHAADAQNRVAACEQELSDLRQRVVDLGVDYGNLKGQSEDLKRRASERGALLAKKPALVEEHDVYKRLAKAFSKDGVPAIIMENVTEDLRNHANEVLRAICSEPLVIDFVTQSRTDAGSWVETFDITVSGGDRSNDDFRDLSGGEQVRISIALRLALSKILMRRVGANIRFLLLDEVDQALDRQGIQALAETLRALSARFKIMVVTHNDAMKEMFDHIVTVKKGTAGSTVRQAAA